MAIDLTTLAPLTVVSGPEVTRLMRTSTRDLARRLQPTNDILRAYHDAVQRAVEDMTACLREEFVGKTVAFVDQNWSDMKPSELEHVLDHLDDGPADTCSSGRVLGVHVGGYDSPVEWYLVVERTDGEHCRVSEYQILGISD